jgi:hypothetical protein
MSEFLRTFALANAIMIILNKIILRIGGGS